MVIVNRESFLIEREDRLDKLLVERFPQYSRSYFQYLIARRWVFVNGKRGKKSNLPRRGDEVSLSFLPIPELRVEPEAIPLTVLYEDRSILCIDKPAGMVVYPTPGHRGGTLANALLHRFPDLPFFQNSLRPGIVHRLDKETSGVLVVAKDEMAYRGLVTLFKARGVKKEYLAICVGHPEEQRIEGSIGRHPRERTKMALLSMGKEAITDIEEVKRGRSCSLIRVVPQTGRTHQIRVHLRKIGCPILGDSVYGSHKRNRRVGAVRQLLHAHSLRFPHPCDGRMLILSAPPPPDFLDWMERLPVV